MQGGEKNVSNLHRFDVCLFWASQITIGKRFGMYICMSPFSQVFMRICPSCRLRSVSSIPQSEGIIAGSVYKLFSVRPIVQGLTVLCNDFVQCTFIFQNQLMFVCSAKCVMVCEFGLYGLRPQEIQTHKLAPILASSYVLYLILCIVLSCLFKLLPVDCSVLLMICCQTIQLPLLHFLLFCQVVEKSFRRSLFIALTQPMCLFFMVNISSISRM